MMENDIRPFRYQINETVVGVSSRDQGFAEYVQSVLAMHVVDARSPCHIDVEFLGYHRLRRPRVGMLGLGRIHGGEKVEVDKSISYEGGTTFLCTSRQSIRFEAAGSPSRIRVCGYYRERPDRAIRSLFRPAVRANAYQQAFRHLILQPVFLREEVEHGYRPIHAGVVTNGDRTLVIFGLSGVGKSTLTLYLASQDGWSFVTDNYALFKGGHIVGVREPVRISSRSRRLIGEERLQRVLAKRATKGGGGRHAYHLVQSSPDPVAASDVIFLQLGDQFRMRATSEAQMDSLLLRCENVLGEFHGYTELASYWDGIAEPPDRAEMRRALIRGRNLYVCTVSRNESLETTVRRIDDELRFL